MRAPLRKVRHDCADLFRLRLLPQPGELVSDATWAMTPCLVRITPPLPEDGTPQDGPLPEATEGQWFVARHPYELLLDLPDDTEVLCPWPGQKWCDVFRFTVGEFRAAWEAWGAAEREGRFEHVAPVDTEEVVAELPAPTEEPVTSEQPGPWDADATPAAPAPEPAEPPAYTQESAKARASELWVKAQDLGIQDSLPKYDSSTGLPGLVKWIGAAELVVRAAEGGQA